MPVLLERGRRGKRAGEHHPARHDRDVVAAPQHLRPVEREPVVVVEDHRDLAALEAQVGGAGTIGERADDLLGLHGVGDIDDGHVRQAAHERDVVDRLMARPARARDARHEADDLHVEVRVRDRHRDLVVGAARDEDAERVDEHRVAASSQAAGDPHQVRLRHPPVEEA